MNDTPSPQTTDAPPAGSIWTANNGQQFRSRGMNGELLHYDMREAGETRWTAQLALPLKYFTVWRDAHNAVETGFENV